MIEALLLFSAATPVLHYQRTNIDGSEPETVVVHARAPGEVEVFKAKSRCTNAAYVTARVSPANGQVSALVGGRLGRDLGQQPFAYLEREADGHLRARLGSRTAPPVFDIEVGERWVLYDFDFADLIAHPPAEIRRGKDLQFDLPLLLTGDEGRPSMTNRGRLLLSYLGPARHLGRAALRYRAHGAPLGSGEGWLWFDRRDGRLLEARLPLANHSEYRDFRLILTRREKGAAAWREVRSDHWRNCPAPG